MSSLAVTWWGHSSVTVELGSTRVGTDPLLVDRLMHLRRYAPTPGPMAAELDLVLVSHLHGDHFHVPSLRRVSSEAPIVVPRGASDLLRSLAGREVVEVEPGDRLELAEVRIDVVPARHDGRRLPLGRRHAPAIGFRVEGQSGSFWYPGDTGPHDAMADVEAVDLALVPVGGWGPTLGDRHLDPQQAAEAVERVGATWALPVHYGTFWPIGMRALNRTNHQRLFETPGSRFADAMSQSPTTAVVPVQGRRVVLHG